MCRRKNYFTNYKFLKKYENLLFIGLNDEYEDLKKEVQNTLKFQLDNIANRLNFVSREEFEIQRKMIAKLQKDLIKLKTKKS